MVEGTVGRCVFERQTEIEMSKGSMSRVRDTVAYKNNYDSIFGNKDPATKAPFSVELLDDPVETEQSMVDKHMELVEKFRVAGGSAEHHALKQMVSDSAWSLLLGNLTLHSLQRADCK
jgi:hypothetical protein